MAFSKNDQVIQISGPGKIYFCANEERTEMGAANFNQILEGVQGRHFKDAVAIPGVPKTKGLGFADNEGELTARISITKGVALPPPLTDAKLVFTFEADTFRLTDGITEVLDQSGNANHCRCENVDFVTAGKAGGALHCEGAGLLRLTETLINEQKDFTITAWVRMDEAGGFVYETVSTNAPLSKLAPIFGVRGQNNGDFFCDAWNTHYPGQDKDKWWYRSQTRLPYERGKWFFLAIVLRDGGVGTGKLLVRVDAKSDTVNLQMVKSATPNRQDIIGRNIVGAIDELAVWQRALSDEELDVLYRSSGRLMHSKVAQPQAEKAKSP